MASKELFLLLRILEERDTGLGRDDVAWAFEPPKKAATEAWVREYLLPSNLLSKEEHRFHETIGSSRSGSNQLVTGRPLSDEDIEHAITSLESSTAAIERQCQLMETQKQALMALKARNTPSEDAESVAEKQQRKLGRDKAQMDLELEEVSSFLQGRLRVSLKQTEAALANLPTTAERLLEKDDRLLDGLQKVIPRIEGSDDDSRVLDEVDKLCHAFTVLEAKAIRMQIDTTYRNNGGSQQANGHGQADHDDSHEQDRALRTELEELSGEIDGLLSLVAENYYKIPITHGLKNSSAEKHTKSAQWSEYIGATLRYLAGRLETLSEHFQHVHAHRIALASASMALEDVLEVPITKTEPQNVAQAAAKTPQKGLKPLRLVQENISEPVDPTSQLLQHLDIRSANHADPDKLARQLEHIRQERQDQLASISASTEEQITKQLAESLSGADVNVRALLGAVFAYTKYNSRRLVDETVQEEVDGLEGKTQELGHRMRSLDLDSLAVEVKRMQRKILSQPKS